jgi:O-methyltransferase
MSDQFDLNYNQIKEKTIISVDRLKVIDSYLRNCLKISEGCIMECGVYKGGSAKFIKNIMEENKSSKILYLFDTFVGMPKTSEKDKHKEGDFSDANLTEVVNFIGTNNVEYKIGNVPDTFKDCQNLKISFAHIDVDIYKSIWDCCEFVWPRLRKDGVIIFDDYGFESCPGAKEAVDEFFGSHIKVLETKQAIVIK